MRTIHPAKAGRYRASDQAERRLQHRAAPSHQLCRAIAALALLLSAEAAWSQEVAAIAGIVTDLSETPLAQARVTIAGTPVQVLSQEDGRFHLGALAPGTQVVEVRLLGYSVLILPVELRPGETLLVELALAAEAVTLAAVDVKAEPALPPELRGFQERRARGVGRFFSRHDITQMQPRLFTDVLRRVPGLTLQPVGGPYGTGYVVQLSRNAGITGNRPCPVLFYVNGVPFQVATDHAINHFLAPEEVVAVEVYASSSDVPSQFNSSMHNARCGVILVWTYSGERRHPSSFR